MKIEDIVSVIKRQVYNLTNLEFYKYWLDNFIVKNKESGKEIMLYFNVKDIDRLFIKLNSDNKL